MANIGSGLSISGHSFTRGSEIHNLWLYTRPLFLISMNSLWSPSHVQIIEKLQWIISLLFLLIQNFHIKSNIMSLLLKTENMCYLLVTCLINVLYCRRYIYIVNKETDILIVTVHFACAFAYYCRKRYPIIFIMYKIIYINYNSLYMI
jgi:hypothetical protein